MNRLILQALLVSGCSIVPGPLSAQVGSAGPDAPSTPPAAQVATDTSQLEDIVVTAQKRAENLQKVPFSITALSSAVLEQRGITSLANMLQTPPPGIVVQPFGGQQALLIVDLRGVTNADPGQGTVELGTAVYIDDVYLGRAQGLGAELADPERIEILRGPQGTLFGRNAEGGAIRIVTKKPTGEFGGSAKISAGNYGQNRYEAHLNLPEIAGFSIKLDYLNTNHDGWTKNPRDPRLDEQHDFGAFDAEGYRASVRWQPLDALTIDYSYDHSTIHDYSDYNVLVTPPLGFIPNGPLAPLATLNAARPLTDSFHKRTKVSWAPFYMDGFTTKASGHTIQGELELSDQVKLRSITAFRKTLNAGSNNLDGAFTVSSLGPAGLPPSVLIPVNGTTSLNLPASVTRIFAITAVVPISITNQKQESQEFQLIGSLDQFEYVLGAYYFHEKVRDFRQTALSGVYTDRAFKNVITTNPFVVGSPSAGANDQSAESRSYAGFAQATYSPDFADQKLHITAGLRYTNDRKTFIRTQNAGVAANIVPDPFKASRVDPAATIAYDIAPNANIYIRYAQAYRAGGVSVRSPTFRPFDAEVNKAFEAGFKSDLFDRHLRLNGAVFENRIHNRQVTSQLDPTGNPAITDTLNAPGVTRIRGVELEATAAVAEGLLLSANYGFLSGHRPASYRTIDPFADIRIQSLPKHSFTVQTDYTFPRFSFGELALHVDYSYASKTPGTGRVRFDAYAVEIERHVGNARLSLQDIALGPVKGKVSGFVKNFADEAYPVFVAPGSNAILSAPRTYGIEFGVAF